MFISLGYNCYVGMALRKIITNQPSLPFDSVQNHNIDSLFVVYKILDKLKNDILDIKQFVVVDKVNHINDINYSLKHFYRTKYLSRYLDQTEQKNLLLTNHELELYSIFRRRFDRLKNNFFNNNQPNLLIYKPKHNESYESLHQAIDLIIKLNDANKIIILDRTASRRKKNIKLSNNAEFIRCGRSSRRIENTIISYITGDIKALYQNVTI